MTGELALLVPILGIVLGVGGPMVAIILASYYAHRTKVARYETVKQLLNGNLTPDQLEQVVQSLGKPETPPQNPRKKSMIHGIILLCLALGLLTGALLTGLIRGFALASLVLGFLGIGNLLIALFVHRNDGGEIR